MGREARRLGMKNTSFSNASGLPDPQHYTTAYDLGLLATALIAAGEWTRRRVPSVEAARTWGNRVGIPVYDVALVGYPKRMREYNERRKREGFSL